MQRIVHRSEGWTRFTRLSYFCAVLFLGIGVFISAAFARASDERGAAGAATDKLPPEKLAAWIDGRFDESWRKLRIEPAGPTSDGEFARRVFLDLIGRIPSVAE